MASGNIAEAGAPARRVTRFPAAGHENIRAAGSGTDPRRAIRCHRHPAMRGNIEKTRYTYGSGETTVAAQCKKPESLGTGGFAGFHVSNSLWLPFRSGPWFSENPEIERYTKVSMDPAFFRRKKKRVTQVLHDLSDGNCRISNVTDVTLFFRSFAREKYVVLERVFLSGSRNFSIYELPKKRVTRVTSQKLQHPSALWRNTRVTRFSTSTNSAGFIGIFL